jgi:hypothetical protein
MQVAPTLISLRSLACLANDYATAVTYEGPPVSANAVPVAIALALAVALGGTLDAAEIVAAAFEPAVALTLEDAVAEAEPFPSDVCASVAGAPLEAYEDGVPGVLKLENVSPGWLESNLPVALTSVAVRRALKPETKRDRAGVPHLRVKAHSGRWLTLQGTLTAARRGHPS